jgi:hypothetical protein
MQCEAARKRKTRDYEEGRKRRWIRCWLVGQDSNPAVIAAVVSCWVGRIGILPHKPQQADV